MAEMPRVIIIAGPNGAGKTTFAREYLPREAAIRTFVNADLIAAGISPFAPDAAAIRAGRIMLAEIAAHTRRLESFAFETTLAGRGYARLIPRWRAAGYRAKLVYLKVASPEIAIARIAGRVMSGGHGIPEHVVRRRFAAGWRNFETSYKLLVDAWALYDNSGDVPRLIDEGPSNG